MKVVLLVLVLLAVIVVSGCVQEIQDPQKEKPNLICGGANTINCNLIENTSLDSCAITIEELDELLDFSIYPCIKVYKIKHEELVFSSRIYFSHLDNESNCDYVGASENVIFYPQHGGYVNQDGKMIFCYFASV